MVSVDGVLHLRTLTADYVSCGLDSVIRVFFSGDG
jgi:hypothetical protein